jgi:hypothetical protein
MGMTETEGEAKKKPVRRRKKSAREKDPEKGRTAEDIGGSCFVLIIAGIIVWLTAYGFDQANWPWALGAVAAIFGMMILEVVQPDSKQKVAELESRVKELEEAVRILHESQPPRLDQNAAVDQADKTALRDMGPTGPDQQ